MDKKFLFFLLLAVSDFGVNLTTFFQENNCDPKCIFETQNLTMQAVWLFPTKCSTVCTYLTITKYTDLTEEQLTTTFLRVKRLIGSISVTGTKFRSVSFLAGLESIDCGNSSVFISFNNQMVELGLTNLTSISCSSFQVNSNKSLRRLGISKLKNITIIPSDYNMGVYIESQSKNFCITTEEMENLIWNVNLDARFGKYCAPTKAEKLCIPPQMCSRVFGDLEIGSGSDLNSMKSVEIIFGSLIINGTNLTNFNFLKNLKYVAQMQKDKSAIIVENNLNLVNISFPKLKRVRSDNLHSVIFTGNNLNMSRDVESCIRLADDLGLFKSWSPIFDGKDCITMNFTVDWPEHNSSTKQGGLGLLILNTFLLIKAV